MTNLGRDSYSFILKLMSGVIILRVMQHVLLIQFSLASLHQLDTLHMDSLLRFYVLVYVYVDL